MENQDNNGNEFGDFFGQAKTGSDGFAWKNFALSEKEANVFRIAPPVKSLRATGRWSVYDSLHYGYTVPNEENPDKPRHKPFRCIFKKNRATGMIEQDCPECTALEERDDKIKAMVAQHVANGKTKEDAEEHVKGAARMSRDRNLDKKHYVLAKNMAGEWGVLKLPHRAKQALDNLIEKYTKENGGLHPLDPMGGVWFTFTRKGKGLMTEHYVEITNESLGRGQFQYKSGVLTVTDMEGIKKCPDLATLNDNKNLTYDQILALVRSNQDPTVAAQVFSQGRRQEKPSPTPPPPHGAIVAAPKPSLEAPPSTVDHAAQIAALQAQLASLQKPAVAPAPQAPPAVPTVVSSPTPATPAIGFADLLKLDPAQFLAQFPDPNKK